MFRLAVHIVIGFIACGLLVMAIWYGSDWAEVAATFWFGWFCGKAHGCCTVCNHTTKWDDIDYTPASEPRT